MPTKHPLHLRIIKDLNLLGSRGDDSQRAWVSHYLGTDKPTRSLKTGDLQKLSQKFPADPALVSSLYLYGTTFDELAVASYLVSRLKRPLDLEFLGLWLGHTIGWAEVDSLCQSNFEAEEILDNWTKWPQMLLKFSADPNIHKRRASLVLLCKPLRQSADPRLSLLSFELVEKLKYEKGVLITKAVSWILRSLVKHHSGELAEYLKNNQNSLPRIAYREALKKLTTGKKY